MYFCIFILKVNTFVLPLLIIGLVLIVFMAIRNGYYFSVFHSYVIKHYPDIAEEILEKNPFKNSPKYFKSLYYEGFPADDLELQTLIAKTKKACEQTKYALLILIVLFFIILFACYI